MYVCELFSCSLISNRTILWIILARILSTAFVHIHENEWTSLLMIFLKSCVNIKGMFNPEINELMLIIHTCNVISFFLFLLTSRRFANCKFRTFFAIKISKFKTIDVFNPLTTTKVFLKNRCS